jgi:L-ribulose-5-phosphate 3-epimerase
MELGIKQGRLRNSIASVQEEFPSEFWKEEFFDARILGLTKIEWLVGYEDEITNPLLFEDNLDEIWTIQKKTGVSVESATLDYLVYAPIHKQSIKSGKQSTWDIFECLLSGLSKAGIKIVVMPIVQESGPEDHTTLNRLIESLPRINDLALKVQTSIALECELPLREISTIVKSARELSNVGFNFDTGNSAAIGNDSEAELNLYGEKLINVHFKDRRYLGSSVPLGLGDVDFRYIIERLRSSGYSGNAILECARSKTGKDFNQVRSYMQYLKRVGW